MQAVAHRVLIAIPAYDEEGTIRNTVNQVREALPGFDLLIVNDGSCDSTARVLESLQVIVATHLCNLGYGHAIQTAIRYALQEDYDVLITLDADGQHHPDQVQDIYNESIKGEWDVLIGSRHLVSRKYSNVPLGRRIGMKTFSFLVKLVTGQRIYDTSSGLKIIKRSVFKPLTSWRFVDLHAEAIVYLMRLGYKVGEFPIAVSEREQGESMYSALSHFKYPLKTGLLVLLGVIQAMLARKGKRQ